ncbi:MAG: helix-turn-helix transcriptional regulator [Allobaculum sp.]|nr:helix-turn-helix transcriptional regulator [Allobaculum sp.]
MKKLVIFQDESCPMKRACKALEGKWKIPVIYVLCTNGTLRYNELKQALGITNVMLSNTLKDLEQEGLILRVSYNEIPPRVDYSLSEQAQSLIPIIMAFAKWGEELLEEKDVDSPCGSSCAEDQ